MELHVIKEDIVAISKEAIQEHIDWLFIEMLCHDISKEDFKAQWKRIKVARHGTAKIN